MILSKSMTTKKKLNQETSGYVVWRGNGRETISFLSLYFVCAPVYSVCVCVCVAFLVSLQLWIFVVSVVVGIFFQSEKFYEHTNPLTTKRAHASHFP